MKNHADRRDLHDPLLPLFQRRQGFAEAEGCDL
ncbi:MAG: hypothetical protein WCA25_18000, partial [Pseudolabrys sp.]